MGRILADCLFVKLSERIVIIVGIKARVTFLIISTKNAIIIESILQQDYSKIAPIVII